MTESPFWESLTDPGLLPGCRPMCRRDQCRKKGEELEAGCAREIADDVSKVTAELFLGVFQTA
jgi:hypothetical protein